MKPSARHMASDIYNENPGCFLVFNFTTAKCVTQFSSLTRICPGWMHEGAQLLRISKKIFKSQ
jgi:hypothetical protein